MVKSLRQTLLAACILTAIWPPGHAGAQSRMASPGPATSGDADTGRGAASEDHEGGSTQDKPWSYTCDNDLCAITTQIRNDDGPGLIAMRVGFTISRKVDGLVGVLFRLPADTRGKTLSFAFAKIERDARGEWTAKVEPRSARVFTIDGCDDKECRLAFPGGQVPATKERPAMDLVAEVGRNNQMLVTYPSGPDYYRTSVLLSGLKARASELSPAIPKPH